MTKKLPNATPAFTGNAERLIAQSTPRKLTRQSAPVGAPNIVLILLDDVGFGSFGTFGGPVPTPTLDRIANIGFSNSFGNKEHAQNVYCFFITSAQQRWLTQMHIL